MWSSGGFARLKKGTLVHVWIWRIVLTGFVWLLNYSFPLQTLSPKRKTEEDDGPGPNSRTSESQPLKRLKVNILKVHKCAVCSFTTEDLAAFHGHLPQHKCDGSSHQCQECGLCYTSHRSLARHLFIVHRLKEPQGLGRYNGRGADDDESQRENQLDVINQSEDGTPSTKCKVCGKAFETEGSLNTHMRTHGMAFIKSKRLSAAEKWRGNKGKQSISNVYSWLNLLSYLAEPHIAYNVKRYSPRKNMWNMFKSLCVLRDFVQTSMFLSLKRLFFELKSSSLFSALSTCVFYVHPVSNFHGCWCPLNVCRKTFILILPRFNLASESNKAYNIFLFVLFMQWR